MSPVEENPYHEAAGHERRHAHADAPVIFKGHLERQHPGYVEREIATCGARWQKSKQRRAFPFFFSFFFSKNEQTNKVGSHRRRAVGDGGKL